MVTLKLVCIALFVAALETCIRPVEPAGNPLTTHVLDLSKGLPGKNLLIRFYKFRNGIWVAVKAGRTNDDGRLGYLITQERFTPGVYKMSFDLASYFKLEGKEYFHPKADIVFRIKDPKQHYHIPLLVTPYSYTTYRGS